MLVQNSNTLSSKNQQQSNQKMMDLEGRGASGDQPQSAHNLIEVKKSQASPAKGPFAITTYVRVRAQTNVMGTENENSLSFENLQEILRKVSKN